MAKKNYVEKMFNSIAPTYDGLNHLLSLGIDKLWRKAAVRALMKGHPQTLLDVACGTGDFALALCRAGVPHVTGIDISEGMLAIGRQKLQEAGYTVAMQVEDCEHLSMADGTFDAVSVAFGVRNFEHLQVGLNEMVRVLHKGGRLCVLELSVPQNAMIRWLYTLYFCHLLPWIGGKVSGNAEAYHYLPTSVLHFPAPDVFCSMLQQAGLSRVEAHAYTFGLCRMFIGEK